jgi:two-component system, NarL family, nitrate/nitrite response regulator NarL
MNEPIRVAILDDHQGIIDGYLSRLSSIKDITVIATLLFGEDLEPALKKQPVDILILDVHVPTSPSNPNPYPIHYLIPRLLDTYPDMAILVISMDAQRTLVRTIMEAGASGFILKDDRAAIIELPAIIHMLHSGGIYLSKQVSNALKGSPDEGVLTSRQIEVLSYCASSPELSTAQLAQQLNIAPSTVRNLLSGAYLRLEVPNRAAAIAKARQLGLITSEDNNYHPEL